MPLLWDDHDCPALSFDERPVPAGRVDGHWSCHQAMKLALHLRAVNCLMPFFRDSLVFQIQRPARWLEQRQSHQMAVIAPGS